MNTRRALLLGLLGVSLPALAADLAVGSPAPEIEATLLDSPTRFRLSASRGKVVIVNFWATWCAPCLAEMPALETYYQQHKDEGVEVLAISMDETRDLPKVRAMAANFSFAIAHRNDADFRRLGRIWRLPMTFVIDGEGILRRNGNTGPAEVTLSLLESTVTPLLGQRRGILQRVLAPAGPRTRART